MALMVIDAVGLFIYVMALRLFSVYNLSIKFAAFLIGFGPIITLTFIRYMTALATKLPLDQLIVSTEVAVAFTQLLIALIILYKLQQKDENDLTDWFMIAVVGALINYVLLPYIVPTIVVYWPYLSS